MAMTASPRSTAETIAANALRLLEDGGPEAVTMRAVAAAAGITPMAIYHHFPNREALLQQVTDREFERLLGFMQERQRGRAAQASHRAMLSELMQGYIDYALEHPRIFDFVFSRERPGARKFPDDFHARRSPTLNVLADAVEAAMKARELRKGDMWEIAFEIWALVHGYVSLHRAGRFKLAPKQFRELCQRAVDRLFDGLVG
jgi:AcrR family transcriptional regulator